MYNNLRIKINETLKDKNLSPTEVERDAGLKVGLLRAFLNGRVNEPKFDTVVQVAKVLKIDISELVSGESTENIIIPIDENSNWNETLFKSIIDITIKELKKQSKPIRFQKVMETIEEIYDFSQKYRNGTIDEEFSKWIINKI